MSSANLTLLAQRSLETLHKTKAASIGQLICGSAAMVTNTVIFLTIVKSKPLHIRCFVLMAHLAVADWLLGLAYVGTGIKRLVRLTNGWSEENYARICSLEMILGFFGQVASLTLALSIAIERTVATCFPTHYHKMSLRGANLLGMFFWMYAVIDSMALIYNSDPDLIIPNCMLVSSARQEFYNLNSKHKISLVMVINLLYAIVFFAARRKGRKVHTMGKSATEKQKKKESQLGQMCAVIGTLYLVTQILTRGILAAIKGVEPAQRARIGPFVRMMIIVNSAVNLFVYLGMSTMFRSAFFTLFAKKKIVIVATNNNKTGNKSTKK